MLLVQNQWQEFNLTTEKDGLDAVIKICITCEEGKINLNRIFNKKKKEFNSIDKGVSSEVFFKVVTDRMKEFFKDIDVTTLMLTDIKKQKNPYATVMELLKNKNFNFFVDTAYFMPPNQHSGNAQTENSNQNRVQQLYLFHKYTSWLNVPI